MKKTLGLVGLMVVSTVLYTAPAASEYRINTRGWKGGAYDNKSTGRFNHCAVSSRYKRGDRLIFSINRNYQFSISIADDNWDYRKGQKFSVVMHVDFRREIRRTATVVSRNQIVIPIDDRVTFFRMVRRGRILRIYSDDFERPYSLRGTSRALNATLRCVRTSLRYDDDYEEPRNNQRGGKKPAIEDDDNGGDVTTRRKRGGKKPAIEGDDNGGGGDVTTRRKRGGGKKPLIGDADGNVDGDGPVTRPGKKPLIGDADENFNDDTTTTRRGKKPTIDDGDGDDDTGGRKRRGDGNNVDNDTGEKRTRTAKLPPKRDTGKAPSVTSREALILSKDLLSSAGVGDYKILKKNPFASSGYQTAWAYAKGRYGAFATFNGTKRNFLDTQTAKILGDDARDCKGKFASGFRQSIKEDGWFGRRLFTVCSNSTNKNDFTIHYSIGRQSNGTAAIVATIVSASAAPIGEDDDSEQIDQTLFESKAFRNIGR